MDVWFTVVIVAHVVIALAIIGLVLLQHGKGADMGSGFGSGASGSLFGATGSANFLSRTTAVLATVFFLTSLGLAYLATNRPKPAGGGVLDAVKQEQGANTKSAPQAPAPASDIPKPSAPAPASQSGSQPAAQPSGATPEGSKAKDVPN
jgi:preprotein translocase subunit SecG